MTDDTKLIAIDDIEFDFPQHILIYGPTMSGKSTLITKIIDLNHTKFNAIFAFGSMVDKLNCKIPREFRFKSVNLEIIQALWDNQKNLATKATQNKRPELHDSLIKRKVPNIALVLDDIMGVNFSRSSEGDFWKSFITSCRHVNISLIISIQYITGISTTMRSQIHNWFITDLDNNTLKFIQDYSYSDKKGLRHIRNEMGRYECLYINKTYSRMEAILVYESSRNWERYQDERIAELKRESHASPQEEPSNPRRRDKDAVPEQLLTSQEHDDQQSEDNQDHETDPTLAEDNIPESEDIFADDPDPLQ